MHKRALAFFFFCVFVTCEISLIGVTSLVFDDFSIEDAQEGSKLSSLNGEWIRIRGFWYPLSAAEGILANAPQLKSCCLGAPSKVEKQLIISGSSLSSLPPERAVMLEGKFFIRPLRNAEGELVRLFVLEEAHQAPSEGGGTTVVWLSVILFFIALIMIKSVRSGCVKVLNF